MKFVRLIFLISILLAPAMVSSQNVQFRLKEENKQIVEILKKIEGSSKYRFFYIREQVDVKRVVSIKTRNATIQDVLDKLLAMSTADITIEQDPTRLRPSDVPILLGDNSKFKAATNWNTQISFDKTLEDILDYWRLRIQ